MPEAIAKRVGVTDILEWIGRESGIDDDLLRSTDRATAEKILSMARYQVANPGRTLPYFEEWQINHDIPYSEGMSADMCYNLMHETGADADLRQKFFRARAARCRPRHPSHLTLLPSPPIRRTRLRPDTDITRAEMA